MEFFVFLIIKNENIEYYNCIFLNKDLLSHIWILLALEWESLNFIVALCSFSFKLSIASSHLNLVYVCSAETFGIFLT